MLMKKQSNGACKRKMSAKICEELQKICEANKISPFHRKYKSNVAHSLLLNQTCSMAPMVLTRNTQVKHINNAKYHHLGVYMSLQTTRSQLEFQTLQHHI